MVAGGIMKVEHELQDEQPVILPNVVNLKQKKMFL